MAGPPMRGRTSTVQDGPARPDIRPIPAWIMVAYDRCPGPFRRFLPDRSLIDGVRWFMLATGLVVMATTALLIALGSEPARFKALGFVGGVWFCWSWITRYRSGCTPISLDLIDGIALTLIALGSGPTQSFGLITFSVFGRGLYGSGGAFRITLVVGLALASHFVADTISTTPETFGHDQTLIGVPVAALLAAGINRVLATYEHNNSLLHAAETRYRLLVEQVPAVTYVQQRSLSSREPGEFKYISPQIESVLGYSPQEWSASYADHAALIHPEDRQQVIAEVIRTDASGDPYRVEYRRRAKDGRYVWIRDEAVLVPDDDGESLVWQGLLFDISDLKEAERRVRFQALHDALTGLPNRSRFLDALNQALLRAEARDESVAVLFLDLDNFKDVNDSFGHEAGDRLLIAVAERLAEQSAPGEIAARLGGDEFTVLLDTIPTHAAVDHATAAAERFLEPMRDPFAIAGQEIFVRASMGVAIARPGEEGPEDLLRQADAALYSAKRQGKGTFRVYDPSIQSDALERLQLETQLTHAIDRQEFRVYYQPIVNLETGQIAGLEALIRWDHPSRGLLGPAEFIAVAEETGQIVPIGLWVLSEACRHAGDPRFTATGRAGGDRLPISVNLSARQLVQPGIVASVDCILRQQRFPPELLTLEITESVSLEHSHATSETLLALRRLGVRLAIDDFGTGHSGLNVLRRRPIQSLKIDRSLVTGLSTVSDDRAIVQAVITFAQILGLQTVAEGIETPEQAAWLHCLGCNFGQGHLFARPLPIDDILDLLQSAPSWPSAASCAEHAAHVSRPSITS